VNHFSFMEDFFGVDPEVDDLLFESEFLVLWRWAYALHKVFANWVNTYRIVPRADHKYFGFIDRLQTLADIIYHTLAKFKAIESEPIPSSVAGEVIGHVVETIGVLFSAPESYELVHGLCS
jgi:hypothetical protein